MMTPEEKRAWEPIRRKGACRFISLYGVGWFGGGMGSFMLWSLYRRDDDIFWFMAPITVVLSVVIGAAAGGFLWLLQEGRYTYRPANQGTESAAPDEPPP